ncbi:hypothetical protein OBBRIDRAFT_721553, partial [Obba rivulosa]
VRQVSITSRLAILYYDYFTTFSVEIERFWKRNCLSWVSALFVVNRYLSLIGPILVAVEYFGNIPEIVNVWLTPCRCRQLQSFHQYYAVLTQVIVAALLLLRTYALYNRDARILCMMIITCTAGTIVSIVSAKDVLTCVRHLISLKDCTVGVTPCTNLDLIGAWSSMLAFDTLVFFLTLARAIYVGGLWKGTLFRIMLRDGALYYGIMVMANIANILTFLVRHCTAMQPTAKGMCTTLTNVVSSTLISRLMLNLRDPNMQVCPKGILSTLDCACCESAESRMTHTVTFTNSEAVFSDCVEDDLWVGSYSYEDFYTQ